MNRTCLTLLLPALILFASASFAASFDGPLQVRNQFPPFLPVNPPYLESAEIRDSLSVGLSHSSVFVMQDRPSWSVRADLELTELSIRFSRALGERTAVGLEAPFLRPSGGFFDRPLDRFHDFLKWGDYGRSSRPMNSFLYTIDHNGARVIAGENDKAGIGDARLSLKQALTNGDRAVSALALLELPTGDAKTGYGSGSPDVSLAVLADLRAWDVYCAYVSAGVGFPGDLKAHQTVPLREYVFAGAGLEAAWWKRFSVLVQTMVQTSPYPRTGIRQLDFPGVLLAFGGRYRGDKTSVEFSVTEDPSTAGAPDFIANLTSTFRF